METVTVGIFGSSEEVALVESENVSVSPDIAAQLPDIGTFLLEMISFLHEDSLRAAGAAIDELRLPDGAIPGRRLRDIGIRNWKMGPVTHLALLTARDSIGLEVWASYGLSRRDRQQVATGAHQVYLAQGIAAAATWAILSRPNARMHVDFLAEQLTKSWSESAALISNGDIIKSFRKWRPTEDGS